MRLICALSLVLLAACTPASKPNPKALPLSAERFTQNDVERIYTDLLGYARDRQLPVLARAEPTLVLVASPEALGQIVRRPTYADRKTLLGASVPDDRRIYVVMLDDPNEMARTLAHEVAHYYLGVECAEADEFMWWWHKGVGHARP